MLDILKINLPGEADYSLLTQTEVPEELCFDTSRLIAVSIKIFFRKIMRAGQGPGGPCEALSCSWLCVASSVDAGGE